MLMIESINQRYLHLTQSTLDVITVPLKPRGLFHHWRNAMTTYVLEDQLE